MPFANWSERSLRSWVAIGMALSILPIAASGIGNHVLLSRGVITPFDRVAARQRHQIDPTQQLRLALWEAGVPVNEFLDAHEALQVETYRGLRVRIERLFAHVHAQLDSDAQLRPLLERAESKWHDADRIGTDLVSVSRPVGDAHAVELADQFDGLIASSTDELGAVWEDLIADVRQDHDAVLLAYERAQWIGGIAGAASLLLMFAGIAIIGRIMVVNVNRLVEGARRFAGGDRSHRIDVQVPPELKRVADEFNTMIGRIHASEAALAAEARSDVLTSLGNRRAFDEALHNAFARMRRLGERPLLVALDLDHFKKINDTYGHAAGDDVLRSVGRTIATGIREVDSAFRIGGEEFVMLLVGTDLGGARTTAERLRAAIAAHPIKTEAGEVLVTTSVGIAVATPSTRPDELVRAADDALYRAKSGGRNRIVVAGDIETRAAHESAN